MKDVELLIGRDDVHDFLGGLWRTDLFQTSHEQGGFVFDVVESYASLPRVAFTMSDERKEHAHFSAWWGAIPHRDYRSDEVHDLYWLHEITHAAEMVYLPDLSHEGFARKMFDNELLASVTSEIRAYFELPGLRARSFDHGIFADRFLEDQELQERWATEPRRVLAELTARRRDVMYSDTPADKVEGWIRRFASQNLVWAAIWTRRYDEIERAMVDLRRASVRDRRGAIERHVEWLLSDGVGLGGEIPFPREAEAFAAVYWKNKADYEDDTREM